MNARLLTRALAALALLAPASRAADVWYDDFDAAAAAAKAAGKDLLVDFTGSDWCGWCIRLHDEVFGKEAFTKVAQQDFVLVALDFPKREPALSRVPDPARNKALQRKYGVRGFPTVLLMSADGEVYAQTGYQKGGVEPYLAHLKQLRAEKRAPIAAAELVEREFAAADDARKLAIFEQVYPVLTTLEPRSPYAARIAPAARWAIEVDPEGERGLLQRGYRALLWSGEATGAEEAAARALDPKNEQGLLELVVRAQFLAVRDAAQAEAAVEALDALAALGFQRRQVGFELYYSAAQWFAGPLEDAKRRKEYAQKAKQLGTEDERFLKSLAELLRD